MPKSAIVFSSDEAFFPICKGLVLSLELLGYLSGQHYVAMIDIGLSEASRAFLSSRNIHIIPFRYKDFYDFDLPKNYQAAQVCRPLIPTLIPGFDTYTWIDSDIWLQDRFVLDHHINISTQFPQHTIIAPCSDSSYRYTFSAPEQIVYGLYRVYEAVLADDLQLANKMAFKPILSSGLFTIGGLSQTWNEWKATIERFYTSTLKRSDDRHGLEQVALNFVVYQSGLFIPLDATYNYHCHERFPTRDGEGKVRVALPPNRLIGAVHLSALTLRIDEYLKHGLLFKGGSYLTQAERTILTKANHYTAGK